MGIKNAGIIGIRMDQTLKDRVDRFQERTGVESVTLARTALMAALDSFEATGVLEFPLKVVSAKTAEIAQFPTVKSETKPKKRG